MNQKEYDSLDPRIEAIGREIIDSAIQVHKALGPGLLESVYQSCMCREFSIRKISFQKETEVPIIYKNMRLESGLRLDLLVEGCVILELKSVEKIIPIHESQLLTYLKITSHRLGFLLNFNVPLMKEGIKRIIL